MVQFSLPTAMAGTLIYAFVLLLALSFPARAPGATPGLPWRTA